MTATPSMLITTNSFSGRRLSVFDDNMSEPRHRWYEFKEGFSSKLVREAIDRSERSRPGALALLDPFSGSGTTLVEAARLGHGAIGVEVNPFMAFTARAKCLGGEWSSELLTKLGTRALSASRNEVPSPLEGVSTFTERPGLEKWLFNRSVLRGFESLDQHLRGRGGAFPALRLAAFASLMHCSNARRDGKCLRYRKGWQEASRDSSALREDFRLRIRAVAEDVASTPLKAGSCKVLIGDARSSIARLPTGSVDLTVTSPPYLNSFDYSDVYRPEMFAGGFVKTNADLMEIRLRTVRSHVQAKWKLAPPVGLSSVQRVCSEIRKSPGLWSGRLPDMVNAYFVDMNEILLECYRVARAESMMWMVVSTSAYAGVEVPVDLILAELGERAGWSVDGIYVLRQLRAAGQHWGFLAPGAKPPLRESLVALRKPTRN